MKDNISRREHYRLSYPINDRPNFYYKDFKFKISDISEKGLKFILNEKDDIQFNLNEKIQGKIVFQDNCSYLVYGSIIRIDGREIVLHLEVGIPLKRIISEQRMLIKKYPNVNGKTDI